jgi:hypothetical protein
MEAESSKNKSINEQQALHKPPKMKVIWIIYSDVGIGSCLNSLPPET